MITSIKGQININDKNLYVSWANSDERYSPSSIFPQEEKTHLISRSWKGEKTHNQFILYLLQGSENIHIEVSNLIKDDGQIIPSNNILVTFQKAVLTDHLAKDGSGCGLPEDLKSRDSSSSLQYDIITLDTEAIIQSEKLYAVWVSVQIPTSAKHGLYNSTISIISANGDKSQLNMSIDVVNQTLPAPYLWKYHLDIWQNPFSVARFHQVTLWSKSHFDIMRPLMKELAKGGQKVITTTIIKEPWNGQTYDHFETMITSTKELDGNWSFNYDIFDNWVSFMMDLGINEQINCYSILPWNDKISYFDRLSNSHKYIDAKLEENNFVCFWKEFLKSFSKHLRTKKWMDKTTLAMDERPLNTMIKAIQIIKDVDPDFKISLAGEYHHEIEPYIYDYSIAFYGDFPEDILERRKKEGRKTTFYTCCTEAIPNTFTFSPLSEATWLGWYAYSLNYDGYLRWAYNSWNQNPTKDSRYSTFSAGDCFLVYPNNISSIRMVKMISGIQDYEKLRIIESQLGNSTSNIKTFKSVLSRFKNRNNLYEEGASIMLQNAREELKSLGF